MKMEETQVLSIPMTIYRNSPFVTINLEGKDLLFLVDSGAYGCLIDKKYVSIPDDMLGPEEQFVGLGDSQVAGNTIMAFFQISDERFCCPFSCLGNLCDTLPKFTDIGEVTGILGGEFLRNYEAVLDYKNSEMRIERNKIKEIMNAVLAQITLPQM